VDVSEVPFLKEVMHGTAQQIPDTTHGTKGIRPCPKVCDLTKKLKGMSLLLERIALWIHPSQQFNTLSLKLNGLASPL
jgi:hypothetical protein